MEQLIASDKTQRIDILLNDVVDFEKLDDRERRAYGAFTRAYQENEICGFAVYALNASVLVFLERFRVDGELYAEASFYDLFKALTDLMFVLGMNVVISVESECLRVTEECTPAILANMKERMRLAKEIRGEVLGAVLNIEVE